MFKNKIWGVVIVYVNILIDSTILLTLRGLDQFQQCCKTVGKASNYKIPKVDFIYCKYGII